jgi:hypothetical protein
MKTEGQVRHKLQQVIYRHLQRAIRTAVSRRPENCIHNGKVQLPRGELRFCQLYWDGDGSVSPCDESFNGLDQCARCQEFKRGRTKEKVREEFAAFLKNSDLAVIAAKYPDVTAMMWVLDLGGPGVSEMVVDDDTQEPEEPIGDPGKEPPADSPPADPEP